MLREVMPIIAGGGVGLVLALFLRLYCVLCVAGSRAIDSARGGYGGGGGVPPLCVLLLFSLFSSSFVSCVLGEVVAPVGGYP